MPENLSRRCVWIPDSDWRKLVIIGAYTDTTASAVIRAAVDATIAGYAELEPILASAFKMTDDREAAARLASERDVSGVRESVPA